MKSIIIFLVLFSSCAHNSYVLRSGKNTIFSLSEESTSIQKLGDVYLTYDRFAFTPVTEIDGDSIKLFYKVIIKNSSSKPVFINPRSISLGVNSSDGLKAFFDEKQPKQIKLDSKTRIEIPVMFKADKNFVEKYGDGKQEVYLYATVKDLGQLSLALYLWGL